MTFADLPAATTVVLCPEVFRDPTRAWSVSADLDRALAVWCGVCRFEQGHAGRLGDLLEVWPMLARQEVPDMGQRYERADQGVWMIREDLG